MSKPPKSNSGNIYIGIGGWTFEPWRGVFYPEKLTQAKELSYAASKLTSIEINGTYYGSQKPESFRKWAREVPDGFVFSLKGPRFATNRRVLAEAGDSVKRFFNSGVLELGDRLGPVLWQFAPTKKFDGADFGKFLELLPRKLDGRALRHVVEVRHDSFCVPEFIALIRQFETPVVFAEHGKYPAIADVASDFVYARLQKGNDELKTCYPPKQLDAWAKRFQAWSCRQRARRPAEGRRDQAEEGAARRVRLRHPRGQDPRAGGGDGIDRTGEVTGQAAWPERRSFSPSAMSRRRRKPCSTNCKAPASNYWSTCARWHRRAGRAFPRLNSQPASTNAAYPICICAGSAPPRTAAIAARSGQFDVSAQDLRQTLEDAASAGGTRRTLRAGEAVGTGLHPLL